MGMVMTAPTMKRASSLTSRTGQLKANGAEGQDRRHPQTDEDALLVAAREPKNHRQDESCERCDQDRGPRA